MIIDPSSLLVFNLAGIATLVLFAVIASLD